MNGRSMNGLVARGDLQPVEGNASAASPKELGTDSSQQGAVEGRSPRSLSRVLIVSGSCSCPRVARCPPVPPRVRQVARVGARTRAQMDRIRSWSWRLAGRTI